MTLKIVGGKFKGRILNTPTTSATRPTQGIVREALFNICQHQVEGCKFLDLFAGSGAIGLEALSRGAKAVTFIENGKEALFCLRKNILQLHVEPYTKVLDQSVLKEIYRLSESFDLIYMDPPYQFDPSLLLEIFIQIETQGLLSEKGAVFLEGLHENPPLSYVSSKLYLKRSRRFGIARLDQFESSSNRNV